MVIVSSAALVGEPGRGAEADAQHRRLGPRAKPLLLPATVEEGRGFLPFAHPQGADPLGSMDLVRPVQCLGRATGKGDAAPLEPDRPLDLLARDLDRGLRLIAPARRRMRVGEFLLDPRLHRLGGFGCKRCRRLIVEVDHAPSAFARLAMRRHSARNRSISASLVAGPKLTRITELAISSATPIATSNRAA